MSAHILIVEDEEKLARFVELELQHEGYTVSKAGDGRVALEMATENDYDLILLDIMLPGINGLEVLRRLKPIKDTPVILLTARDAVMDKVAGLDGGAVDYVTKPFAIEELLARIRVALKAQAKMMGAGGAGTAGALGERGAGMMGSAAAGSGAGGMGTAAGQGAEDTAENVRFGKVAEGVYRWNDLILNEKKHEVRCGKDLIELTNREFTMLKVLLANMDIVLSRDTLLEQACGYDYLGETNVVDVYIRYLRSKIDDVYDLKMIQTVRGVGYVIKSE